MKKFYLYLGILLVFVGVSVFIVLKQSEALEQKVYSGEAVIRITDDGFNPQEIRITRGTKVSFVNESEVRRWPASDLHPTHTIYVAFDSQKPIAPGEEWRFVFEKTGKWNMHDHLAPYLVGTIYVTDTPNPSY